MAGGRPDKYNDEVRPKLDLIVGWARDGLTDELIAKNLGIGLSTLYKYKTLHIELVEALKKGKEVKMKLIKSEISKVAKEYDLGEVLSIKLIQEGWVNHSFDLKTTKGRYIL